MSVGLILGIVGGVLMFGRGRVLGWRRSRGGFFRLDEKDGLLGGSMGGKVD